MRLRSLRFGLVVSLLFTSCFAERRGLSRDRLLKALEETQQDQALPNLDELLALRVPEAPPRPPEVDAAKPTTPLGAARLAAVELAQLVRLERGNHLMLLRHPADPAVGFDRHVGSG